MQVRCYAQGKFYTILCPEGTRLVRGKGRPGGKLAEHDHLIVPLKGKTIRIPAEPPELLPLLAESGNFGVLLVGDPEPDVRLADASCPGCREADVNRLRLSGNSKAVHSNSCGSYSNLPVWSKINDSTLRTKD
jgi:hypothetical protein